MVPARRPDLFQTPEFQTQATAEGPSSERQESARLRHDLKRALEERNRAMKRLQETTARGGRGKGSRVLEQRLEEVRRELGQRNRENTRLLDMARAQAEQLAAIEPLPGLFLTRIKAIVRLAEGDDRDPMSAICRPHRRR